MSVSYNIYMRLFENMVAWKPFQSGLEWLELSEWKVMKQRTSLGMLLPSKSRWKEELKFKVIYSSTMPVLFFKFK